MKSKTWLKDIVEETMHEYYLKEYPVMVDGIKKLLISGQSPNKIKSFCDRVAGKSITAYCVSCMIDYVNKQIKN